MQRFLTGMKKILRSSSKFDSNYWVVKGLQGTNTVQKLDAKGKIEFFVVIVFVLYFLMRQKTTILHFCRLSFHYCWEMAGDVFQSISYLLQGPLNVKLQI